MGLCRKGWRPRYRKIWGREKGNGEEAVGVLSGERNKGRRGYGT
jgi:hypothetical protein